MRYIFDILCSLFPRLAPRHPIDSCNVNSSSSAAGAPAPDLTGHMVGGVQDNSGIPLAQALRPVTPPVTLNPSALNEPPKPCSLVVQPPTNTTQTTSLDHPQHEDPLAVPLHSQAPAVASQQLLLSQRLTQPPQSPLPQSQDHKKGMFNQASNISLSGIVLMIDNNADNASNKINV